MGLTNLVTHAAGRPVSRAASRPDIGPRVRTISNSAPRCCSREPTARNGPVPSCGNESASVIRAPPFEVGRRGAYASLVSLVKQFSGNEVVAFSKRRRVPRFKGCLATLPTRLLYTPNQQLLSPADYRQAGWTCLRYLRPNRPLRIVTTGPGTLVRIAANSSALA